MTTRSEGKHKNIKEDLIKNKTNFSRVEKKVNTDPSLTRVNNRCVNKYD